MGKSRKKEESTVLMKKKIIIAIVAVVVLVCGGMMIYLNSDSYQNKATHLPDNTYINGVDCSGLSVKEAATELQNVWNKNKFKVNAKDGGEQLASFPMKGIEYDVKDKIQEFIGTNFISVLKNHSGNEKKEHKIAMKIKNSKTFDKKVLSDSFLDIPYEVKTKDASVDMSNTDFKLVKEVQGDNVDKEKVLKDIKKNITKGDFKLGFAKDDYLDKPDLKIGDEALKELQKFDKENYSQSFIYDRFNGDYRITPADIAKMRPVDKSGNAKVNKKAVAEFMKKLAYKVNTQYFDHKFKSTNKGKIIVPGGTYGYVLDKEKEAKKLAKDLEANKDFKRRPVFSQEPYYKGKDKGDGRGDIGDSYAEVSISAQTLWLYIKGKKVLTTSVTTGQSGHDTEQGCYYVNYKQKGATLSGPGYSSPVSYWMPFNSDQGCHDAPWRSDFGSGAYGSNGSHGCVNMPYYAAQTMFNKVEKGFPVIVHE